MQVSAGICTSCGTINTTPGPPHLFITKRCHYCGNLFMWLRDICRIEEHDISSPSPLDAVSMRVPVGDALERLKEPCSGQK